jgi:hypothetical protein
MLIHFSSCVVQLTRCRCRRMVDSSEFCYRWRQEPYRSPNSNHQLPRVSLLRTSGVDRTSAECGRRTRSTWRTSLGQLHLHESAREHRRRVVMALDESDAKRRQSYCEYVGALNPVFRRQIDAVSYGRVTTPIYNCSAISDQRKSAYSVAITPPSMSRPRNSFSSSIVRRFARSFSDAQ